MGLAHGLGSGDWLSGLVSEPDELAILTLWVECTGFDMLCLSGNVG